MSKKYIRVRAGQRRAFPMRIFIDKTTKGFEVSQFDGKYKTTLKAEIQNHYSAMIVAKEWEKYYWKLGRGAKIIDFSKDQGGENNDDYYRTRYYRLLCSSGR